MMGASWEDDNNGWVAGTAKNGRTLTGMFYKTTDGGNTYSLEQVRYLFPREIFLHFELTSHLIILMCYQALDNCFPIDMDFRGSTGAAACLSSSGTSGTVAMYL